MICPKCKGDTRVLATRAEMDGAVVQRERACVTCSHRFPTFESTVNVVARRRADAAGQRVRRLADPETARARDKAKSIRRAARAEAAETGRPVAEILAGWTTPSASNQRSTP